MKRSLLLIFFLAATFAFAKAQNIFTTTIHTYGDAISAGEINTFTIDEAAKIFIHKQGANEFLHEQRSSEFTYAIISRTLDNGFWRYDLVNAEGVLVTVAVDQGFKSFTFHLSTDPEHISNIYSN